MVDVFGGGLHMQGLRGPRGPPGPSGKLQNVKVLKKVTITKGKYSDYIKEIQESYKLGVTPYRLHTSNYGTWVTPIRVYDNSVFVLDNEGSMSITGRTIQNDPPHSVLVYWVKGDIDDDDATVIIGPQGPPGPSGSRGPQGKRGADGSAGLQGSEGKRGAVGPAGPRGPRGPKGGGGIADPASKSFVIDMGEHATNHDCVFIASLQKDVAVVGHGLVLDDWKTTKSDERVVQTRSVGGQFIISQPSQCSAYIHCRAPNTTQV